MILFLRISLCITSSFNHLSILSDCDISFSGTKKDLQLKRIELPNCNLSNKK